MAQPLPNVLGIKSRFSAPDGSEITVEQLALQHYATPEGGGWTGAAHAWLTLQHCMLASACSAVLQSAEQLLGGVLQHVQSALP